MTTELKLFANHRTFQLNAVDKIMLKEVMVRNARHAY